MRRVTLLRLLAIASVVPLTAACEQLLGLNQFHDAICEPGSKKSDDCHYTGPAGTRGVGLCRAGERTCAPDGLSWSDCSDPVLPQEEDCSTPEDENCDGEVNEASSGCCTPGATLTCYSGPEGTEGVGVCKSGTQTCGEDGKTVSACSGDIPPQQETCANPVDEDCDGHDCAEWAEVFGDTAIQFLGAVAVGAAGDVVVTGEVHGAVDWGTGTVVQDNGSGDVVVVKLDPSGKALWATNLGDISEQLGTAIAVDSTGDVLVGAVSQSSFTLAGAVVPSGLFVAKLAAADGHPIWVNGLGGGCASMTDASVTSIAVNAQNDVLVGGSFCGAVDFGNGSPVASAGGKDGFLALMRGADGSAKSADGYWGRVFGDQEDQEVNGVAIGQFGTFLVAGTFAGQISLGIGANAQSVTGEDGFVATFSSAGDVWSLDTYGGQGNQRVQAIRADASGNYVITGSFYDSIDLGDGPVVGDTYDRGLFVARFDPGGTKTWSVTFPGAPKSQLFPTGLALDAQGNVGVAGLLWGSMDLGAGTLDAGMNFDMVLFKLDANGKTSWAKHFLSGGNILISAGTIAAAPTGETVMAGGLSQPTDLGTGLLTPAGTDSFVAKFAP